MKLEELESTIHNVEQYLFTLKKDTPHYRDTKKRLRNLKRKYFNIRKNLYREKD